VTGGSPPRPPRTDGGPVPDAAVVARGIVKEFGYRRALDGVSLEIPRGQFFALFGPNGAGKTTLMKILTSVSRPTEGTVTVAGVLLRGPTAARVRPKIGYISHHSLVYDGLTGFENLLFFGRLYGVERPAERAEQLLRDLDLWAHREDRAGTYSRGMLQRLSIARALVHDPEVLFLDEPFTGLDPAASRLLTQMLGRLRDRGRSALVATHDLAGGWSLSDRWAILARGRIVADGLSAATSETSLAETYFDAIAQPPTESPRGSAGGGAPLPAHD
jgi:heme exporter protein A